MYALVSVLFAAKTKCILWVVWFTAIDDDGDDGGEDKNTVNGNTLESNQRQFNCRGSIMLADYESKLSIFRLSIGMVTAVSAVTRTIHNIFEWNARIINENEPCNRHWRKPTIDLNVRDGRVLHKSFSLESKQKKNWKKEWRCACLIPRKCKINVFCWLINRTKTHFIYSPDRIPRKYIRCKVKSIWNWIELDSIERDFLIRLVYHLLSFSIVSFSTSHWQ